MSRVIGQKCPKCGNRSFVVEAFKQGPTDPVGVNESDQCVQETKVQITKGHCEDCDYTVPAKYITLTIRGADKE